MNKKVSFIGFLMAAIGLALLLGVQSYAINNNNKTIRRLEQELIEEYDRGYSDGENRYIDKYHDLIIENTILKEQLKTEINIVDFDIVMEWTIRYYEVEAQALRDVMSLNDYLAWKEPELFDKLLDEALKWEGLK